VVKADKPSQDGRDPGVDIYNLTGHQRQPEHAHEPGPIVAGDQCGRAT
jgi:hypothetical protein